MTIRTLLNSVSMAGLLLAVSGPAWSAPPSRVSSLPATIRAVGGAPAPQSLVGGGCLYALDDGTPETDVGAAGSGTIGAAVVFELDACTTIDTISVAWGPHGNPGQPATVAIYNDPNQDGDPSDITLADLLVTATVTTSAPGGFVDYSITPITVTGTFVVVAITDDDDGGSGADHPLRLDTTVNNVAGGVPLAPGSWWLGGIANIDEPFGSAVVSGPVDNFGIPGNWLLRAAQPVIPIGACCTITGCDVLTESECNSVSGTYLGNDTGCTACGVRMVTVPDVNGNGVDDVAVLVPTASVAKKKVPTLGAGSLGGNVFVKDGSTGALISQYAIRTDFEPIDLAVVPDYGGSSADEIAILVRKFDGSVVQVRVRDALTGGAVNTVGFSASFTPIALTVVPSIGDSAADELAVLARREAPLANTVFLKDADSGNDLGQLNFSVDSLPLDVQVVLDHGSGTADEVAVLTRRVGGDNLVRVFQKDADTGVLLQTLGYGIPFDPIGMAIVPDAGGTTADELAVLRRNPNTSANSALVKDADSGIAINQVGFSPDFNPIALAVVPSFAGTAADELAVVARNSAGVKRVFVRDTVSGSLLNTVNLTQTAFIPLGLGVVPSFGGTAADEVVVLTHRTSNGDTRVRTHDASSDAQLSEFLVP